MKEICARLGVPYIFKASYDKANRSSGRSARGPGIDEGLQLLAEVRRQIGVPVLTDVHTEKISPPSLGRRCAADAGLPLPADRLHPGRGGDRQAGEYQEGQFLAPGDMKQRRRQGAEANGGADTIMVCERGASFGYNNLVSDMRSWRSCARQLPGRLRCHAFGAVAGWAGHVSGGQREFVPVLARAAVAVGIAGLFMETHPCPEKALSDGPNSWPLDRMESDC
jgi:2-dehydro-3-deoxyphosphooctonate aldolase (KDO 8-P synthase)